MPSPVLGMPVFLESSNGAALTTPAWSPEIVPRTFNELAQSSSKLLSAATYAMIVRGASSSFENGPAAPPAVASTKVLHTAVPHLSARALLPLCTIRVCIV